MNNTKRWWALVSIALAVALVVMDGTIANVALPVVIRDLDLSSSAAQWVNAIYSLVLASLIITAGRAGDMLGRRKVAVAGLAIFTLGSLGAGLAVGTTTLLAARTVQGVGAACVLPATLSTINATFSGRERSIAFAVYGSMIGGMAAVGPLVGGWLTESASWRWAFWLTVPLGLLALLGIRFFAPNTANEGATSFDVPGTLLATGGLAAIVFALIQSTSWGWRHAQDGSSSPLLVVLVAGVLLLAVFCWLEARRERAGRSVLVHLSLLKIRTFGLGSFTAFVVSLGEFGLIFVLPLLLQGALGYGAIGTGWLMMALALGTFAASGLVPRLAGRLGTVALVRLGLAFEVVALVLLAWLLPNTGWQVTASLALYGAGIGLASAQLTDTIMSDVPVRLSGEASGMQTTVRQLGSAMGVATLGGLMIGRLTAFVSDRFAAAGLDRTGELARAVHESAGAAVPGIAAADEAAGSIARIALIDASRIAIAVAALVLLAGLIAALALPNRVTDAGDGGVEGDAGAGADDAESTSSTLREQDGPEDDSGAADALRDQHRPRQHRVDQAAR
ncbi:MAG: MFS transporter [Flaviflexus sp.]|nr:MFS transporter [Flaviflexus sp.]